MEQALINTVIAFKLMEYSYSLKYFFKDEFKKNNVYVIPFSHILHIKRKIFPLIRDACDYVCPCTKQCDGHQFLDFIEELYKFQRHAVENEKCFFRYFYFYNFHLKSDEQCSMENQIEKIAGWDFNVKNGKDLSHLSYSQRLSYLN